MMMMDDDDDNGQRQRTTVLDKDNEIMTMMRVMDGDD
jgi:hypothetical protein